METGPRRDCVCGQTRRQCLITECSDKLIHLPLHSLLTHLPVSSSASSSSDELSSPNTSPTPVDRTGRPETLDMRVLPSGSKSSSRRGWGGKMGEGERTSPWEPVQGIQHNVYI